MKVDEAKWRRVHDLAIPIIILFFREKKTGEKFIVCKMRTCCFKGILINKVPLITNTCPY